jgi:hypothetical protein
MEHEIDEMYDTYEREYGSYFTNELDLSWVHNRMEHWAYIGMKPHEVLESAKALIREAVDQAEYYMYHGYDDEDGEDY